MSPQHIGESLVRMETKLDAALVKLDDHEARVRAMESKTGKHDKLHWFQLGVTAAAHGAEHFKELGKTAVKIVGFIFFKHW